jgi:hypothetical protein
LAYPLPKYFGNLTQNQERFGNDTFSLPPIFTATLLHSFTIISSLKCEEVIVKRFEKVLLMPSFLEAYQFNHIYITKINIAIRVISALIFIAKTTSTNNKFMGEDNNDIG